MSTFQPRDLWEASQYDRGVDVPNYCKHCGQRRDEHFNGACPNADGSAPPWPVRTRKHVAGCPKEADPRNETCDCEHLHGAATSRRNNPADIAKLLRAIAGGTQARESKQDIIFNAAAELLDEMAGMLKTAR